MSDLPKGDEKAGLGYRVSGEDQNALACFSSHEIRYPNPETRIRPLPSSILNPRPIQLPSAAMELLARGMKKYYKCL